MFMKNKVLNIWDERSRHKCLKHHKTYIFRSVGIQWGRNN